MLFFVFLNIEINKISKSFLNLRFSISALIINFIWTPLFVLAITKIFFKGETALQTGFIMLMVTPCTDWYLVFTGAAGGNVTLGASILPLNLILQIVLLPAYLLLFMGAEITITPEIIIQSILFVLIVPLVSANIIRFAAKKINLGEKLDALLTKADDIQFVLLCLAIFSMFVSEGPLMLDNVALFIRLLPFLLLFFALVFSLAFFTGKALKLNFKDIVPLIFSTSARNSPIALAIAAITFPNQPVISLVLVMGPLIELPLLAINSQILKRIKGKI